MAQDRIQLFKQTDRYIHMTQKKKKRLGIDDIRPMFRIRLDYKTIITVRSLEIVNRWLEKYPHAVVVN